MRNALVVMKTIRDFCTIEKVHFDFTVTNYGKITELVHHSSKGKETIASIHSCLLTNDEDVTEWVRHVAKLFVKKINADVDLVPTVEKFTCMSFEITEK